MFSRAAGRLRSRAPIGALGALRAGPGSQPGYGLPARRLGWWRTHLMWSIKAGFSISIFELCMVEIAMVTVSAVSGRNLDANGFIKAEISSF